MKEKILDLIKQPSTWRGLALLGSVFGITLVPEMLLEVGIGIAAAIGVYDTVRMEDRAG